MKVALVHDHLAQNGGAEKVLKYFSEMFPESPIFTLVHDKEKADPFFTDKDIRTSFLQRLPGGLRYYKHFLPLMPAAFESFDLKGYDIVLSTVSAMAKGVITDTNTVHVCYCHTPTRYLWSDTHSYVEELPYGSIVKRALPLYLSKLRQWDYAASARVDSYIANSGEVQSRIKKYYRRDSEIIHPPAECDKFQPTEKQGDFFLTGGRLVPYKRYDMTIEAFNKLKMPLKVFGDGPELQNLKKMANANVEFLGRISDEEQVRLYSECRAFIHPQVEDFGITMVEAMASGRPVIAFRAAGAKEVVKEGVSGLFFDYQNSDALAESVIRFSNKDFDQQKIREYAEGFQVPIFKENIQKHIDKVLSDRPF